jgi:glycosyltransferase involved in cell wall biosynthesis
MASLPLISVIIPAHQAAAFLRDAIESVLTQDYRPLEVIVADDGSTDGTRDIARSYGPPVSVLEQPHRGAGAARNLAISHAAGRFLAFLDADDLWLPGKLSMQMRALASDPSLDLVFGHVMEFRAGQEGTPPRTTPAPGLLAGSVLMSAVTFHRVGWFRADLRMGEFIDWMARGRDLGLRSSVLPETVLRRRIHTTNLGIRERQSREDYARLIHSALERRRAAIKDSNG